MREPHESKKDRGAGKYAPKDWWLNVPRLSNKDAEHFGWLNRMVPSQDARITLDRPNAKTLAKRKARITLPKIGGY